MCRHSALSLRCPNVTAKRSPIEITRLPSMDMALTHGAYRGANMARNHL
jgi:hypothetical protein